MVKTNIIFDMETADPDDLITLCFLSHNPKVNLIAVTVTPGTSEQIGLIRKVFERLEMSVPLGAKNPLHRSDEPIVKGKYVSEFYYKALSRDAIFQGKEDDLGHNVLNHTIKTYPDATLLTGAPLHNLRMLLENHPEAFLNKWVAQGGFAGDSVVPAEHRLTKFTGRETCPTFNFNGDPKGALLALASDRIGTRTLVSKNVCHDVVYDRAFHERYNNFKKKNPGTRLIFEIMSVYLKRHDQKALHDPLAACVALNHDICQFKNVDIYRSKGEWGAKLNPESSTEISVAFDRKLFEKEFNMDFQ
jgi:pyrimidine-specific ribonucleoside hydrolase